MTSPDLDARLARYLEEQEADPIRNALNRIAATQLEHEQKDTVRHEEVVSRLDAHGYRLQTLEREARKLEKDVEDTGRHNLHAIELAAEARGLSIGKRQARSEPPALTLFMRAARSGVAKAVGIGVGALVLIFAGWLSRHLGVGSPAPARAATVQHP
jgi:hypothetical protein